MTEPAADGTAQAQDPSAATAPAPSWDELFKDQDPVKVKEALEQSRKWETRAKENFEARQRLDAIEAEKLTVEERLTARAEKAERERDGLKSEKELAGLRAAVSAATGVPASALRGSTKDELEAHAAELAALLIPPTPSFDGGTRSSAPAGGDMNDLIRAARRR